MLKPSLEENQQSEEHMLEIFTDSDWGGNKTTRKSVSVAHFYWNGTLIQKAVALSSCEAEYVPEELFRIPHRKALSNRVEV